MVIALAAAAASGLEATREPWYHSTFGDLSLHGWPVIGRAVAAFSIGLLVGAVVGRSLPALIVAAALCVVLLLFEGMAQDAWTRANFEVIERHRGDQWRVVRRDLWRLWLAGSGRTVHR